MKTGDYHDEMKAGNFTRETYLIIDNLFSKQLA
jgi:hypothetical protein